MITHLFKLRICTFAFILVLSASISCKPGNNTETENGSSTTTEKESIPDSIVQYLITSAADDFRQHQPPTATDFRNIKIGYVTTPNNTKLFVLCGEFLSKEDKDWMEFTTIKTSGYEQYIGKMQYCQDAKIVITDPALSADLKNKLTEK